MFDNILEKFAEVRRLPGTVEIPFTRWESFLTYMPWRWNNNHKTKWIRDPNSPKEIAWRRHLAFYEGTQPEATSNEGD